MTGSGAPAGAAVPARTAVPTAAAAVSAVAGGALVAWRPGWMAALAVALAIGWGLASSTRLTYTLFAVLFLVPPTADPGYPVAPVWTILFSAASMALLGRLRRTDPDAPFASPGMLGFVLPAALTVAAAFSWTGIRNLAFGLLPVLAYATVAWHVVEEGRRDPGALRRIARTFAWVGVPLAALAVYQRMTGSWPLLDEWAVKEAFTARAGVDRSAGTVGHPIVYGTYCMAMMCVAVSLRGRLWQVPFAANALGLLLSGSRSAWIAAACALVVWYLAQDRKLTRRGVYTAAALVLAAATVAVIGPSPVREAVDVARSRLSNLTGQASARARFERLGEAWSGITESPRTFLFGQGPEAHVRFFEQIGIGDGLAQAFDNSYATLWYDFGLIGLGALVLGLALLFVRFRSVPSRMLLTGFCAQIWFFDCYLWPCAVAVAILAAGLAVRAKVAPAPPVASPAEPAAAR